MRARLLLGFAVVVALGCGSKKFVPVSGKVTLNGKPLPDAAVSFQPIAGKGSLEAGVASTGKTNQNGEFTLTADTGESGAVVGKHNIIITAATEIAGDERKRSKESVDKVPPEWHAAAHTFDVPPGGTDQANFEVGKPSQGKR